LFIEIIAIHRRIEEELTLTHVGTEGNELADRMSCSARRAKKKNCIRECRFRITQARAN
jgi:hypothetical protein